MRTKTVLHIGEVSFSDDRDPVAMAVNQIFKIEKHFGPDELGCTNAVLTVVGPVLLDHKMMAVRVGEQTLPGQTQPTALWRLSGDPAEHCDSTATSRGIPA